MPVFDTPEPVTATVELPIGELRVTAGDRTDTEVVVRATPADQAQADAVRIELVGRDLRVTGPRPGLLQKLTPRTPGRSLEIEIALPSGSSLSARTTYGGVTAEGGLASCEVRTDYGDVLVADAATADLAVGYGRARVTGSVTGDATLAADHGGVRVAHVGGAAVLRSKHGAIRADHLAGTAELTGTHGDIDVDAVDGDVRVRTAYGSVRLGRVARGEVTLSSTHGRLDVGVAGASAAWLDLDTGGRVVNALTARDDATGFTETVTVHARSREGDIVIRRA
ncbi:DUF4097 family beta strand repeat-containing protein [Pseudonocardia sp. HH130630-07]|uniref:DUF4097 family beta strand repeat-containing protein n=1 Tax=Pseudonocardia sp. HH130630-07 TaxID=1690815 RepID=UPI000814EA5B|nr:DUF4097 family beta strand repeat-containing protein [Pseudonocardia sp. HH130630-07]ANY06175.1 hypothetical protein AFB00_07535 [Pseudonocardia sp. HH130630-07]